MPKLVNNIITDPISARISNKKWLTLIIILAFAAIIRIPFIFNDSLWPDEALYLLNAQSLTEDITYLSDYDGKPFFLNPPLFMYILSGVFKISGNSSAALARGVCILFGIATVALTYLIASELYGIYVAMAASTLLAANPLHVWMSTRILLDVPLTFLVYLAIFFMIRKKSLLSLTTSILAVAMKFPAATLFPVYICQKANRAWITRAMILAGLLVPASIITCKHTGLAFPFPQLNYFLAFVRLPNLHDVHIENQYFLGFVIIPFFAAGLIRAIKNRDLSPLVLWVIFFLIFRIFTPWVAFRISRYTLPLYPGVLILAAYGAQGLLDYFFERFPERRKFAYILVLFLFFYVISVHGFRSFSVTNTNARTFVGFTAIKNYFPNDGQGISVLTSSPRQIKYLAPGLSVYDLPQTISPQQTLDLITTKRIDYVILDRWSPHQPKWAFDFFFGQKNYEPIFRAATLCIFRVH